jgi:hypothetical protein
LGKGEEDKNFFHVVDFAMPTKIILLRVLHSIELLQGKIFHVGPELTVRILKKLVVLGENFYC